MQLIFIISMLFDAMVKLVAVLTFWAQNLPIVNRLKDLYSLP